MGVYVSGISAIHGKSGYFSSWARSQGIFMSNITEIDF